MIGTDRRWCRPEGSASPRSRQPLELVRDGRRPGGGLGKTGERGDRSRDRAGTSRASSRGHDRSWRRDEGVVSLGERARRSAARRRSGPAEGGRGDGLGPVASLPDVAGVVPATRGLIAAPWTPASLSLFAAQERVRINHGRSLPIRSGSREGRGPVGPPPHRRRGGGPTGGSERSPSALR
jgi:hypothetical protein